MSKIRLQRYDKHNAAALLHFDTSLTRDECGNTWSAVGSPTLSSDYHKFGTKSIFVNNENYIQSTDSFTVGGSDLTIEAWIYNLGGQATFFSFGTPDSGLCLCTENNSHVPLKAIIGTSQLPILQIHYYGEVYDQNSDFNNNTWQHLAVVYQHDLGKWTVFVNGYSQASLTQALDSTDFNLLKIGGDYGENSSTGCYIDDFRITNAALYTQDFTPADSPATVNALAPVLEDIKLYSLKPTESISIFSLPFVSDYVKALLLFDDDSDPLKDECGNSWTPIGSPTISATNALLGKALYLNGSSSLKLTDGITLGGKDFTIDFFAYPTKADNWSRYFNFAQGEGDGMGLGAGQHINLDFNSTTTRFIVGDKAAGEERRIDLPQNFVGQFAHYAIVYQHAQSTATLFFNGHKIVSLEDCVFPRTSLPYSYIGQYCGGGFYFYGYIDQFRVSDGIARWTEDFTPPTHTLYLPVVPLQLPQEVITRFTPDQYTKVLMHFDDISDPFKDECGNTWSVYSQSIASPIVSSANAKFGNALQFTTPGQQIQTDYIFTLGGQDFTIDFWIYIASSSDQYGNVFWITDSSSGLGKTFMGLQDKDTFYCFASDGTYNQTQKPCPLDQLFHCAIVYQHSSSTVKWFTNGQLYSSNSWTFTRRSGLRIELGDFNPAQPHYASIDEFRISDGIARWTEDFTPPTAPYDIIISTQPIDNPVKSHIKIYTDSEKAIAKSKYPCNLAISSDSISLDNSNLSRVVFADFDGTGTLSATSADTSIATVSVSGKNINIVGKGIGTTTITVTLAESADYEGATAAISVTSDVIPALNQCTPTQIKNIITAGKHTLAWNVGDITAGINIDNWWLSETSGVTKYVNGTYYAKIIGMNHNKEIETAGKDSIHFALGSTSTGTDIAFITTQFYNKEISSSGYAHLAHSISSTATSGTTTVKNTNSGGWASSKIRTLSLSDSNSTKSLLNRLPTEWTSVMATVTKYTDNTGQKSTSSANVTATSDKLFIPAHYEVFGANLDTDGTTHLVNTYEYDKTVNGNKVQVQYDYFKTNRVRYKHTATSTACIWWLRSPSAKGSITYRDVKANGDFYGANASCSLGVVPCFAIAAA